jgi:putative flippase GtrA
MTNPLLFKVFKFATVGGLSFLLDMLITYTGKEKLKLNQYVANTISFFFAASFNFALNRLWTFQSNDSHVDAQAMKFFASMTIGLGIATAIIYVLNEKFGINFYLSKIIAIAVVMVWNFTINNLLIFTN